MVNISPRNISLNESEVAFFYCNATGNPAPNVTWSKANDRNHVLSSRPFLSWIISGKDAGDYVCTAWNGVGQPASETATLIVQSKTQVKDVVS